jgi:hypothetical protein
MSDISLDFDHSKLNRGFADINKATVISTRNTLNVMAALTRKNYVKNVDQELVQRNTFTKRSLQFEKTESDNINQMESKAGALDRAGFMELQELGGDRVTKSGANLAIPTNFSRGGRNSGLVGKGVYLRRIKKRMVTGNPKKHYKSRRARNVARAYIAQKKEKFVSRSSGIYSVSDFQKTGRAGISYKRNMIYNTQHRKTKVKKTPMLEPATLAPIGDAQNIFNSQVNKLLRGKVI